MTTRDETDSFIDRDINFIKARRAKITRVLQVIGDIEPLERLCADIDYLLAENEKLEAVANKFEDLICARGDHWLTTLREGAELLNTLRSNPLQFCDTRNYGKDCVGDAHVPGCQFYGSTKG